MTKQEPGHLQPVMN